MGPNTFTLITMAGKRIIYPIENVGNLDSRHEAVGICPLRETYSLEEIEVIYLQK